MRITAVLLTLCLAVPALAATSRQYLDVTHEGLVLATAKAISMEANVRPDAIERVDCDKNGGKVTILRSPYVEYSRIEVMVESYGKYACAPRLKVKITTGEILHTRHKEPEWRVHEVVLDELCKAPSLAQTRPTSLPPTPPPDFTKEPGRTQGRTTEPAK